MHTCLFSLQSQLLVLSRCILFMSPALLIMDAGLFIMYMCNSPAIFFFLNCRRLLDLLEPADTSRVKAMIGYDSLDVRCIVGLLNVYFWELNANSIKLLSVLATFQAESFAADVAPPPTPKQFKWPSCGPGAL